MFGWISSLFSGKQNLSITLDGCLVRYVYGKSPRTIAVDTKLEAGPGLNDDEFSIRIEDSEWELGKKCHFSVVRNKQGIAAFAWDADKENTYNVFILSDASRLDEAGKVVACMLWKSIYGEAPTEGDQKEMFDLIGSVEFPFNLETLERFEEEASSSRTSRKSTKSESRRGTVYEEPVQGYGKFGDEKEIYSCKGDFFLLEPGTNRFHEKGCGYTLSYLRIGEESRFTTVIAITSTSGKRVLATEINSTMTPQILLDENAITFSTLNPLATWGFIFQDENEVEGKKYLVKLIWESQYLTKFSSLDEDEQFYLFQSYVDGKNDNSGYESEDFMDIDREDEGEESEEDSDDDIPSSRRKSKSSAGNEKNSLLVDSAKHGRAYVARGNQIGIFDDRDANYLGRIKVDVRPTQFMLHDNERKLLLTSSGNVQELDLTKEKVVAEYTAGKEKTSEIKAIGQVQKYAEQTNQPLFAAMNNKSIWGMDTRIDGRSQAVNKETYSTNPKFNVFSTSSSGQLAVGSEDGIIRLYSGVSGLPKITGSGEYPKRAKTNLPGFGDELIGMDVSGDGKWILGTCKQYLIVVPTEIDESTGFELRMGKRKPSPRRLQLHPNDLHLLEGKVSFTPAKFNTGADGETWIVTSSGDYIVTWNFARVRKNHIHDYVIKRMHDQVSSDQFLSMGENVHGGSRAPIIVALDNDVVIEKRIRQKKNPFQSRPSF